MEDLVYNLFKYTIRTAVIVSQIFRLVSYHAISMFDESNQHKAW